MTLPEGKNNKSFPASPPHLQGAGIPLFLARRAGVLSHVGAARRPQGHEPGRFPPCTTESRPDPARRYCADRQLSTMVPITSGIDE